MSNIDLGSQMPDIRGDTTCGELSLHEVIVRLFQFYNNEKSI